MASKWVRLHHGVYSHHIGCHTKSRVHTRRISLTPARTNWRGSWTATIALCSRGRTFRLCIFTCSCSCWRQRDGCAPVPVLSVILYQTLSTPLFLSHHSTSHCIRPTRNRNQNPTTPPSSARVQLPCNTGFELVYVDLAARRVVSRLPRPPLRPS